MYGFGAAPQLPDGTPVSYQQGGVLFLKRYVYSVYGLAFALTKVLVEDGDHIRIGQVYARHLAQSLIETKETLSANVLNNAFTGGATAGGDGVALISTAHPIVNGTFSNQLATSANLSQTSLEQMLIQIRQAVDNNGKKIRLVPRQLIVAPGNIFQAEVLLKSVLRTGNANNDINPVKSIGLLDEVLEIYASNSGKTTVYTDPNWHTPPLTASSYGNNGWLAYTTSSLFIYSGSKWYAYSLTSSVIPNRFLLLKHTLET